MIITELEKYSVRAALAKAIRQGTLVPGPCALCGVKTDTLVYVGDYSAPERIKWLCRTHKAQVRSLSALQRFLLKYGLRAFNRSTEDVACGAALVGCFRPKSFIETRDRRVYLARYCAEVLALKRLQKRGLVEHPAPGHWRLTRAGVAQAKFLHPEVKPNSKGEQRANIALRQAFQRWQDSRPRRRKRRRGVEKPPGSTFIAWGDARDLYA